MEISFIKFSFVNLSSFVYQTASSMVLVVQPLSLITFAIMIPFRSKTFANPLFKLTSKNLLSVYYRELAISLRISIKPSALIIIAITPCHFNSSLLKCIVLPHSIFEVSVRVSNFAFSVHLVISPVSFVNKTICGVQDAKAWLFAINPSALILVAVLQNYFDLSWFWTFGQN